MKHIVLAAALLATPAMAGVPRATPQVIEMPQLTQRDAAEILSLVQGATVKVSDLPEVARLETLLDRIAHPASSKTTARK